MTWLAHWLGVRDPNGAGYLFWSGVGGDSALFAGVLLAWRHATCHQRGCWRLGRHHLADTPYRLCARHHPHVPDRGPTTTTIKETTTP